MKRPLAVMVFSLTAGTGASDVQGSVRAGSQESAIDLVFVANEGVLISTDSKTVLIDALFTDPNPEYAAPPHEMLDQMETGQAPFDDIDLVLVTHNHADHFSPSFAGDFLVNNPRAVLVAAVDAVAALRDSVVNWVRIQDRVISISLEPGAVAERTVAGINIKMFRTLHSGERESPQNLMYLIEMDGRKIFHEGDSDGSVETFARFGLGEESIDLALVHCWFPLNEEAEGIIREILRPDHVGLFHLSKRLMADAPGTIGRVSENYDDMFLLLTPGERRTFR